MRGSDVKPNMLSYGDGEDSAFTMTFVTFDAAAVLAVVRKILLAVLALGMVGSTTELILLAHTEDWRQWIPLVSARRGVRSRWLGIGRVAAP
jgi:hypothetical protein